MNLSKIIPIGSIQHSARDCRSPTLGGLKSVRRQQKEIALLLEALTSLQRLIETEDPVASSGYFKSVLAVGSILRSVNPSLLRWAGGERPRAGDLADVANRLREAHIVLIAARDLHSFAPREDSKQREAEFVLG